MKSFRQRPDGTGVGVIAGIAGTVCQETVVKVPRVLLPEVQPETVRQLMKVMVASEPYLAALTKA